MLTRFEANVQAESKNTIPMKAAMKSIRLFILSSWIHRTFHPGGRISRPDALTDQ